MKHRHITHTLFCFAALSLGSLAAQDDKKTAPAAPPTFADRVVERYAAAGLDGQQVEKIKKLATETEAKMAAFRPQAALTPQQMLARNTAEQQAIAAGKTGQELKAATDDAVTASLTPEQKKAQAELAKLNKQMTEEIMKLLSDEQKAKLNAK